MTQTSQTTKGGGRRPALTLELLERINTQLAPHDYVVSVRDNGKPALCRIERGGVHIPGHPAYDRYVIVRQIKDVPAPVAALWQEFIAVAGARQ